MSNEDIPSEKIRGALEGGGILCVLGLYLMIFQQDFESGFVLFGIGIAIIASTQWAFMKELWRLLFDKFKKILGHEGD